MKHAFRFVLLPTIMAASFALSGCGGGGGGSAIPSGAAIPGKTAASAVFQITVPAKTPQYVSPNTQSVSITLVSVNGAPYTGSPVIANISATAPGCASSGGTISCSIPVPAQPGSDVYSVAMFAGTNATGATLSAGQATATITAGILNTIPVTMNGTVDSISVSLGSASPVQGTAADFPVTVTAKDATGATIVGPGNYNNPITLSNSDTSGATSLSTTSVAGPGTTVTLHYTGAALTSATISAASTGIPASKITNATLTPGGAAVKSIASGSTALAIYTNSAGQTFAYIPSPLGLVQVLVSSGSTLGASFTRHAMSSGGGTVTLTPAPDACAADPVNVRLYCIAYSSSVVNVLDLKTAPATVFATYTTNASSTLTFTGGSCMICGVAYDAADNGIIIATANGYELYSAPPANALVKTIAAGVSENFGYNPLTNQVWSPHYPGLSGSGTGFDLADVATGKLYTLTPSPTVTEPDQGAVDNGTNIGITSEEFSNNVFLLPFSLATLNSPASGQFTDPFGQINLTSSLASACDTMLDDIAVDSTAHLAFFTGEFCTPGPVGVAQLPSSSGASPTISDWSFVNVPNVPAGTGWVEAYDPHAVAAFNLPPICADCGAVFNLDRSYVAVVDLKKLLAAPRDTTDTHMIAPSYDLICNSVITFIATDATKNGNSGCANAAFTTAAGGGSFPALTAAGFAVNGGYGANNGGVTINASISTEAPAGFTIPAGASGTPVLYLSVTPTTSLTFTGSGGSHQFNITTITVPPWFPTGRSYNYYVFDLTAGAYCGSNGPATLTGNTLDFSSAPGSGGGSVPGSGCLDTTNLTVPAGHHMQVVLTYQ